VALGLRDTRHDDEQIGDDSVGRPELHPVEDVVVAVRDGDDYILDGVKLWTTNGVVADLLVVMARVPKSEDGKGGITAFVVEAASEGVTVENRNAFMGLRGLENGVTRFHRVRVPAANRIGPEGAGLKIALTTLNTGRLSLPAMCAGAGKWCLKIAREWTSVREQWGKPVAFHEAVGSKISFIAATTFALEAVVESQPHDVAAHVTCGDDFREREVNHRKSAKQL